MVEVAPHLLDEWHEDNTLDVHSVSYGLSVKAKWRCRSCGHVWDAVIFTRSKGVGCPECAKVTRAANRRRPNPGNSFAEREPELSKTWDYERNATTPADHNFGSADKFWFKCDAVGHSFLIGLDHYGQSRHCPECRVTARSMWEMQVTRELQLAGVPVTDPAPRIRIAGRTRPFAPDIVIADWNVIVECDGHQWHQNIERDIATSNALRALGWTVIRLRAGRPLTSELDIPFGKNPTVAQTMPPLLARLEELGFEGSGAPAPNLNPIGSTSWFRRPAFEDSFAAAHPELVVEWSSTNLRGPDGFTSGSGYIATWECVFCGESWSTPVSKRSPTLGCPDCTRWRPKPGESIADARPDMLAAWDPANIVSPHDIRPGNKTTTVRWLCPDCGHRWESTPLLRSIATHPCNECWGRRRGGLRKPAPGDSLAERFPELAAEWSSENEMAASEVSFGSNVLAKWVCPQCGETYESKVVTRTGLGGAHRQCSLMAAQRRRRAPKPGESLLELHPEVQDLWDWERNDLAPSEVVPGAGRKAYWRCPKNPDHGYQRSVLRAVSGGFRCPDCVREAREDREAEAAA